MSAETMDRSDPLTGGQRGPTPAPGLVLVFAAGKPAAVPLALDGAEVEIGRDHPIFAAHPDTRVSRRNSLVRFDGRRFMVIDLGSRNGTFADGAELPPDTAREAARVIRVGDSLLVPIRDVRPMQRLGVRVAGDRIEGPSLQHALEAAAQAARLGKTLHITGESGAGKEGLARAFHACGPASGGPFQAVNCATIPEGVAERLLFGTKRGAYSGAEADAQGYMEAAHGGTLFLDEVAELSPAVQAKLLRVLETGEVLPLGASKPRRIELRFCSATHRDLRAHVAAGTLREDLYFRIATPRVIAPPLRERPEEIPWLLQAEAERTARGLALHVSLVEACLLRAWPGNVRELLAEARSAAQSAHAAGSARVERTHLSSTAGSAFAPPGGAAAVKKPSEPTRAHLVSALKRAEGNVSAAARELGAHRTQLRRWLARHGLDARAYAPQGRRTRGKGD
ncbi:sigma 54-interacting transcriptional regulator [Sorangium sp. So ce1000]|uniref:sigma 54-interacting transcriptional regulator n=1 Tax=Sorangium sp. So ce1000 TaxID=3133325 RepID=UPI003F601D61